MVKQSIYISTALDLTEDDVTSILRSCDRNNTRRDITGLLLYNGRNFMQFLEGSGKSIFYG